MQERETIKQQLTARHAELAQRLERINQDVRHTRKPLEADFAEQATERENDQVLDALGESLRAELAQIAVVLGQLDRGEYGVCEVCGEKIPCARLEALPNASRCVTCEENSRAKQVQHFF